ncbi:MAG: H/ACA RNA-protein complex protein Gar1 [Candidatus Thermoplasmatota archaeon]
MAHESLGKVIQITERGALVKAPRMVPIGTTLVDVRNQPAGRVIDVLGPVTAPYLLVLPPRGKTTKLDREVYLP